MCMSYSLEYVGIVCANGRELFRFQSMVESTNTKIRYNGIVNSVIFHYFAEFSHHKLKHLQKKVKS